MNRSSTGGTAAPPSASAPNTVLKNTLIAAISTFLSHYFNPSFIQSAWLTVYRPRNGQYFDPDLTERRILELKTRFLYCVREAVRSLINYRRPFDARSAFQEDTITESLQIISTPERDFTDLLLNRCTEVMVADISSVTLTDAICGQFLRKIFQMVRNDVRDPQHVQFLYLFCIWKMPEVLFEPTIGSVVRRQEIRSVLTDSRMPRDFVETLREMRGPSVFGKQDGGEPVDEGWEIEQQHIAEEPKPRRRAWGRLFQRSSKRKKTGAR